MVSSSERERNRERNRERKRERQRERERQADRCIDGQRDRETDKQTDSFGLPSFRCQYRGYLIVLSPTLQHGCKLQRSLDFGVLI